MSLIVSLVVDCGCNIAWLREPDMRAITVLVGPDGAGLAKQVIARDGSEIAPVEAA
jgi:hypothetical protein